ncbi:MAG: AsmA family protein [Vicingus serpentipes]|nr:AsmA family protein [Vicingus serpentipes]
MKKFLKIFGFSILFLIILIIALPIVFKGKIVEKVKEEANNNLNAKVNFGDFDLGLISTFPNFNFSIDDVTVDGINQFEGTQLANIKNLTLKVDLMSLISGDEIKIKTIFIDQPVIHAVVLADTTANWDIAKASEEEVEEESTESSSFKLGLKDLTIKNATITYNDATMDLNTSIKGFHFNLSGDMTESVTDLVTHTVIDTLNLEMENIGYFKNTVIEADATIKADLANGKYTFTENEFRINELILGLDGWVAFFEDKDDIELDLKFNAKQTAFKNILSLVPAVYMTDFASVKTDGKLALDGYAKGTYTETNLPAFGLDLKVEDAMFKYPDLPKSVNNIQVDLHVENPGGSEDNTLINLKKFYMELAGNPIEMNLKVSTPISDPNIDAGLKAKLNLASVRDVMPMEEGDEMNGKIDADVQLKGKVSSLENEKYEEFNAKGQFSITDMNYKSDSLPYDVLLNKMQLNFSPQYVELATFDSKIGKSDIKANGKIENFIGYAFSDDEDLKGRFNLNSNLLDLTEFMEEDSTISAEATSEDEEPLSVIEVPKNIDFTLNSNITKVLYDNMEIDNLKGELIVKDQKVSMNNVNMNLLGGSMLMNGFYETTNPKKPGISYDMNIQDFDIQTVVKTFNTIEEMAPVSKYSKGRFNTSLKVIGSLDEEMMPDLNTLTGNGDMLTKGVKVEGFKALDKLADALKNDKLKTLTVDDTHVKFEFKDGRVYVEPFDVKLGKATGTMSGSNGFDQSIDYKMTLKVPTADMGAGEAVNKLNQQAAGLGMNLKSTEFASVDVLMTGTVDDPKIKVSLKDAVGNIKEEVKEQIKEKIEDIKDDAKAKAKEEADKLLAKAKEESDKIRAAAKNAADKIRAEGQKQNDDLIKQAGSNPFKKKAAEVAGKKLIDSAENQAKKVEAEGDKQADAVMAKAQSQADGIMKKVESK